MSFTIFLLLRALPSWLALPRDQRDQIAAEALAQSRLAEAGCIRFFDAEAFTAHCSDVAMLETDDLQKFYHGIERLRDSALFATPYFELVAILPAIENGHRDFATQEAAA